MILPRTIARLIFFSLVMSLRCGLVTEALANDLQGVNDVHLGWKGPIDRKQSIEFNEAGWR